MSEKMLNTKKLWDKYVGTFVKWVLEEKSFIYRLPKMLIALALLFVVANTLGLMVGLGTMYLPLISTFLILACLIVPPILLLSVVVIPKISSKILLIALTLSVLLCLIMFGTGMFSGLVAMDLSEPARKSLFPNNTRFPLGNLGGIAVDSDYSVYLAVQGYSRIQKYNNEGEFLNGWFVKTGGGVFDMWIENNNTIHVVTARPNNHDVFNSNGILLERTKIASNDEYRSLLKKAGGKIGEDADGNAYLAEPSSWSPKVIKINPSGEKTIAIKDPFYFHLVRAPWPSWHLMIIGVLMSVILAAIIKFRTVTSNENLDN